MRLTLIFILVVHGQLFAAAAGAYTDTPNMVGQITSALLESKIDVLTPKTSQDDGKSYSYHLKSVEYRGILERSGESIILASALFLRSSARGSESPPARGHGFLLCLSRDFRLVSHCRLDFPRVELVGTQLRRGGEVIADFAVTHDATRRAGYLIDGDTFLPYPFSDAPPAKPVSPKR